MRHWKSVLHVLRCISGTIKYGLLYPRQVKQEPELIGYSDSDFAGDMVSRKSCTGYVINLGEAVIEWASRTQRTVTKSTMEAEWTALCEGTRYAEYIRGLLNELGSHLKYVKWWCGNASTVITATTLGHNGRTRHLDEKSEQRQIFEYLKFR